jgi:catechol 2,3-dioxygenase-like lactoylglutathione lyase family enzyme
VPLPITLGLHHVGLAVPDVDAACKFFCEALDWTVIGRNDEYPSAFVTDGTVTLTLWRVSDPVSAVAFDRRSNIGLHHLALAVIDEMALQITYERVMQHPGVVIEFAPGPVRAGSDRKHFICAMPGGLRLEFTPLSADQALTSRPGRR